MFIGSWCSSPMLRVARLKEWDEMWYLASWMDTVRWRAENDLAKCPVKLGYCGGLLKCWFDE